MVRFYLADAQTKLHEANLLQVKPGLAAQAVTDPKEKNKIDCIQWISSGKCPRKDKCPWKHDPANKGPQSPEQAPKGKGKGKKGSKSKTDSNKTTGKGKGKNGEPGKIPCQLWKRGNCKYGEL